MSSHTTLTADVSRTDNRQLVPAGQRVTETAAFVALRRAF
jgi:hypothetical protein